MEPLSFPEAVKKLAKFNIRQEQVYLIELIPLAEMAWADGKIQSAERDLLFSYLNHHVDSINRLAGCTVIGYKEARKFVEKLINERPTPEMLKTVTEVIISARLKNNNLQALEKTRLDILNACLDIAASAVTKYPYGLTERFTQEEKDCYHKIAALLSGRSSSTPQ